MIESKVYRVRTVIKLLSGAAERGHSYHDTDLHDAEKTYHSKSSSRNFDLVTLESNDRLTTEKVIEKESTPLYFSFMLGAKLVSRLFYSAITAAKVENNQPYLGLSNGRWYPLLNSRNGNYLKILGKRRFISVSDTEEAFRTLL